MYYFSPETDASIKRTNFIKWTPLLSGQIPCDRWCPLMREYTVPQSLFKNLKILDLDNTLVVEIQKGILLYSCHIVRKFLNIDTEHNTQQSHNAEARRR
jgi:hypothetical protein